MCEVLRNNFDEVFPEIEERIKACSFVAIDNEFSGITIGPEYKTSLFDSSNERYQNLKSSIEQYIIIQVGLTTFSHSRKNNAFDACTYNIPVFPRSFGSIDTKFLCQSSSLEFLCNYNFDFNKFVYDGIPYLTLNEEEKVRKDIKNGSLFRHLERSVLHDDERSLQAECSKVAEWIANVQDVESLILTKGKSRSGVLYIYLLHMELRRRFTSIWTFQLDDSVKVVKVTPQERKQLMLDTYSSSELEETLINNLLGFSRIFKLLVELKKPIVGHNLLLDLMLMYNCFREPLPKNYETFKKNIHHLFPDIYDTKHISFQLKNTLKKDGFDSNSLSDLYEYFQKGRGSNLTYNTPVVLLQDTFPEDFEGKYHNAAWDSYCTGFCFLLMGYVIAYKEIGREFVQNLITTRQLFTVMEPFKNKVNVIRGGVSYLCLGSSDPKSERPQWLIAQSKKSSTINISEVAELFAAYGSVDVKHFTKGKALVAVGNYKSYRDILRNFKSHESVRIVKYNPLKHSPFVRVFLWCSFFISSGISSHLLYNLFVKK